MYPTIHQIISSIPTEHISEERKATLQPLVEFVQQKVNSNSSIYLNFICTHNSRRSHLAQIWAQTMANFLAIPQMYAYSGGTEATALFPKIAETLSSQGFEIQIISENKNPIYAIKYSENEAPVIGFSKTYDHFFNPKNHFAAIMTCDQADGGCPFVAGAEKRIPITYQDPKLSDGTAEQEATYQERSLQIATEMKFVFAQIQTSKS